MSENRTTRETLSRLAIGMAVLFLVTLSIIIARRMSSEALAVVIGVVFGVLAAIPTMLILAYVLVRNNGALRRQQPDRSEDDAPKRLNYPPVVIVQPPYHNQPASGYYPAPRTPAFLEEGPSQEPNIRVVGEDD